MSDLISRKYLYEKMVEKEELARQRVLDTPTHSPAYLRYVAQLNERTALKHEIADAPPVEAVLQWIPCNERLPEKYGEYLCCDKYGEYIIGYPMARVTDESFFVETDHEIMNDCIAWIPLPEPYKADMRKKV